jgi:hypothetical protein
MPTPNDETVEKEKKQEEKTRSCRKHKFKGDEAQKSGLDGSVVLYFHQECI